MDPSDLSETDSIDLPSLTFTFPETPEPRVLRDNLVSWLRAGFGSDRKSILLTGPSGVGKSILLAQFVEAHRGTALSFFVGPDLWASDPRRFLSDITCQLQAILGSRSSTPARLGYDQLKATFSDLWAELANHAKRGDTPYYLVIDALDQAVRATAGESILDLVPRRYGRNVYLLASAPSEMSARLTPLTLDRTEVPCFAQAETAQMLEGCGLDPAGIEAVQTASGGLPAYVTEVRRRLQAKVPLDRLLSDLSGGLGRLHALEWENSVGGDETTLSLLAVQVCASVPLSAETLASVAEIDSALADRVIAQIPFLRTTADGSVSFVTDAHRNFARTRLTSRLDGARNALVKYYEAAGGPQAMAALPALYTAIDDLQSIRRMLSPASLSMTLDSNADIAQLRESVLLACQLAEAKHDPASLVYFSVAAGFLGMVRWRFHDLEGQIRALVALGDLDGAYVLAQQPLLPEDRLKGIALIATALTDRGQLLPPDIADLIDALSEQVPAGRSPQEAAEIAATFFQVRPAVAVALIQRCTKGSARAVDEAMALLALATQSTNEVDPGSYISDDRLRAWVRSLQGPGSCDAESVIRQAAPMSDLGGRLLYVSTWCNRNRKNPDAHIVISSALDWMTEDSTYLPSLRVLRQICEPLDAVDVAEARPLTERLEWLLRGMERAPMREYIRLQLLLAKQEWRWSPNQCDSRLIDVLLGLPEVDELDTRAYGFVRVLMTLSSVDPADQRTGVRRDALEGLNRSFEQLLGNAADHYDLTCRIIRAATQYDPELGTSLARCLNTAYRRNQAFYDVVTTYARTAEQIDIGRVVGWIEEFTDLDRYGGPALAISLDKMVEKGSPVSLAELGELAAVIARLPDPGDRALCYASASMLSRDTPRQPELLSLVEESLAVVDDPWRRAAYAYRCVEILAKEDPDRARSLFVWAQPDPAGTASCDRFFGAIFANSLAWASDGLVTGDAADAGSFVATYTDAVSRVPSRAVQIDLLARAGVRLGLAGMRDAELELASRAVAILAEIKDGHAAIMAILAAAPLLLDRDQDEFTEMVSHLPRPAKSAAIRVACDYLVSSLPSDVPVDIQRVDRRLDYERGKRILSLAREADEDWLIAHALRSFVKAVVRSRHAPSLTQRQMLALASQIRDIAKDKLPDPENIRHDGYVVLLEALAMQLEAASGQKGLKQDWNGLANKIGAIPNAADRVYLNSTVAEDIASLDGRAAHRLARLAEGEIVSIPDQLDRAARTLSVAEAYAAVGDQSSERTLLETAFSNAVAVRDTYSGDRLLDQILELADRVSPEFAASLTSLVDDQLRQYTLAERQRALDLGRRPDASGSVHDPLAGDPSRLARLYSTAAMDRRKSLASGMSGARHVNEVCDWLVKGSHGDFDETASLAVWAAENAAAGNWAKDTRKAISSSMFDITQLVLLVGERSTRETLDYSPPSLESAPSRVYRPGALERERAHEEIAAFISGLDADLIVDDPYFTPADLHILRFVPRDLRVIIVTSTKAHRTIADPKKPTYLASLAQSYQAAWGRTSDDVPPRTEVFVLGTDQDKTPQHDRHLLSRSGGLELGTSVGGLGYRATKVDRMADEQCQEWTDEVLALVSSVFPMLGPDPVHVYRFRL